MILMPQIFFGRIIFLYSNIFFFRFMNNRQSLAYRYFSPPRSSPERTWRLRSTELHLHTHRARVPWNMLYFDVRVHNIHKSHGLNERPLIQNMLLVNSKLPETFEIFTQMSDSVFLPISQWGTIGKSWNTHKPRSCSSKSEKRIRLAKSRFPLGRRPSGSGARTSRRGLPNVPGAGVQRPASSTSSGARNLLSFLCHSSVIWLWCWNGWDYQPHFFTKYLISMPFPTLAKKYSRSAPPPRTFHTWPTKNHRRLQPEEGPSWTAQDTNFTLSAI